MVKNDITYRLMKSKPEENDSIKETRLSTLKKEQLASLHYIKQQKEMSIRIK